MISTLFLTTISLRIKHTARENKENDHYIKTVFMTQQIHQMHVDTVVSLKVQLGHYQVALNLIKKVRLRALFLL